MKLPKPVYPHKLSHYAVEYGEYVLVRNKEGVLLAFPCHSPYIKKLVINKIKRSQELTIERGIKL